MSLKRLDSLTKKSESTNALNFRLRASLIRKSTPISRAMIPFPCWMPFNTAFRGQLRALPRARSCQTALPHSRFPSFPPCSALAYRWARWRVTCQPLPLVLLRACLVVPLRPSAFRLRRWHLQREHAPITWNRYRTAKCGLQKNFCAGLALSSVLPQKVRS